MRVLLKQAITDPAQFQKVTVPGLTPSLDKGGALLGGVTVPGLTPHQSVIDLMQELGWDARIILRVRTLLAHHPPQGEPPSLQAGGNVILFPVATPQP